MNALGSFWYTLTQGSTEGEREIEVLRINFFHCERLQSRGVKPENSADEACFHFFKFFDGVRNLFQAPDGLRDLEQV